MATDLVITDLVNGSLDSNNEWVGTGVFDKLISAVNKNIEGQYNQGRITSTDYANVYLGGMQSVIAQSMQYLLQEKQVEAQTDLLITQREQAELDGAAKRAEIEAQTALINSQKVGKDYENANILPEQKNKLLEEIDLLQTQDSELVANGVKDRILKDKQAALEDSNKAKINYEVEVVLPKQVEVEERKTLIAEAQSAQDLLNKAVQKGKVEAETELVNAQGAEVEAQTALVNVNKEAKDYEKTNILPAQKNKVEAETEFIDTQGSEVAAQTALVNVNKEAKDYELENILPAQKDKVEAEKDLIAAQKAEVAANAAKTREVKDKDILVKTNQASLLTRQEKALGDSLLKDLFKDASGGFAMAYADLPAAKQTPPHSWTEKGINGLENLIREAAGVAPFPSTEQS